MFCKEHQYAYSTYAMRWRAKQRQQIVDAIPGSIYHRPGSMHVLHMLIKQKKVDMCCAVLVDEFRYRAASAAGRLLRSTNKRLNYRTFLLMAEKAESAAEA